MTILNTLRQHKEEIEQLAAQHGAHHVRIFGSAARGEDTEASDIDILVEMDEDRTLLDLIGFQQALESMLHRPTDVLSVGGISPYLKDRILSEAVQL